MTSGFESAFERVLADIEKKREDLERIQRSLNESTGSARSARRQVSATVDARGEITALKFHGQGYRSLPPAELADIIVSTIREARVAARTQMWESVQDLAPNGAQISELINGDHEWSAQVGEVFSLPQPLMDLLKAPPDIFSRPATVNENTDRRPAPRSDQD